MSNTRHIIHITTKKWDKLKIYDRRKCVYHYSYFGHKDDCKFNLLPRGLCGRYGEKNPFMVNVEELDMAYREFLQQHNFDICGWCEREVFKFG